MCVCVCVCVCVPVSVSVCLFTAAPPAGKKQRHNMMHVEVWLGDGPKTIGARWNNGKVQVFDSYKFSPKSFTNEQYLFRSIDTWLMGICKRCVGCTVCVLWVRGGGVGVWVRGSWGEGVGWGVLLVGAGREEGCLFLFLRK